MRNIIKHYYIIPTYNIFMNVLIPITHSNIFIKNIKF